MARGRIRRTRSKSTASWIRARRFCPGAFTPGAAGAGLDSQSLAALGPPRVDHGPSAPALHANEEAVRTGTSDFGSLVGSFHGGSPKCARRDSVVRDARGPNGLLPRAAPR